MPGKRSRYSASATAQMEITVLSILNDQKKAMTIDDIQKCDMSLAGVTSQKLSRVLGKLIEMGFVRKGKSKSLNRMMYKAVSVMEEEGYDVE